MVELISTFHRQQEWFKNKSKEFPISQDKLTVSIKDMKNTCMIKSLTDDAEREMETLIDISNKQMTALENSVKTQNEETNTYQCNKIINENLLKEFHNFVSTKNSDLMNTELSIPMLKHLTVTLKNQEKTKNELDSEWWGQVKKSMVSIYSPFFKKYSTNDNSLKCIKIKIFLNKHVSFFRFKS